MFEQELIPLKWPGLMIFVIISLSAGYGDINTTLHAPPLNI